ncbi:flavin reductase like domain-containing protein [Moniliophthora roreri MCA 2997]|uniref:Flavin reductase like domain-containing protein n=2 Tax=Moniliophthora roreri TaxID=221103 RepID=V2WZB9_MONRO|nr:flavin reductase like domain-containing protein [Moniliophthora roreri MCA 2997]KAI3620013.1 flavin reductase like domain-containing protein [Moniliophthora roreri]
MSRSLRCAHHHQKHILRRLYSSHHNAPDLDVKHQLRALLRESAQPVTVVTALLPSSSSTEREDIAKRYHGATLSSFTSIAMDPYPLISFSLRVPSRMGKGLSSAFSSSGSVSSLGLEGKGKGKGKEKAYDEENTEEGTEEEETHLVINLLSSTQTDLAVVFSRPDLYPHPFTTPIPTPIPSSPSSSLPQGHERQEGQKLKVEYALNRSGIPILSNSLGALSCRLVCSPVDLSFYSSNLKSGVAGGIHPPMPTSELYIARVIRVHHPPDTDVQREPLLYHRRAYTSCR